MRRGPSRVRRAVVVGAALVALSVSTLVPGAPSRAAVPTPSPTQAVVTVYVGDVRTGATTVGPLAGATFGLFRTRPADSTVGATGYTSATPDFTCVSDAAGDCSFVVPIGTGSGQVPQSTRMWLAAVAGPPGYYVNPYWQTAPLTGGTSINNRLLWPTPALVGGQTYRSGATWVTDPGLTAPAGSPEASQSEYTRRVASGGMVGLSRANPAMPSQCGLNVALVADLSSSMTTTSVQSLKTAMDAFVGALQGTPSQVALFTFGTDSPAAGYPANTGLQSVATTADAAKVKAQYAAWSNSTPTNYTNWDRGLAAVAAVNDTPGSSQHVDLVVLITDGNPTVYGPSPTITGGTGYTRFRELDAARASANLLKSQGSRVVAVGVGTGASGVGTAYNLQTISGLTAYNNSASSSNIVSADYLQTTDFTAVGTALRSLVLAGCAPSISVAKRIVPTGGTIADAYTPNNPWTLDAATTTAPATIAPATATTNPQTGATSFDVTLNGVDPGTFTVNETQQTGYTLYQTNADGSAAGTQNAACVDKSSGTDVPIAVTNIGGATDPGLQVDVGSQDIISCVIYNQEPPATPASVLVFKRWRIVTAAGTQDYLDGAQPSGLRARLSLTGPGGAGATAQPWAQVRGGYDVVADSPVTMSETTAVSIMMPECSVTQVTVEDGLPSATAPASGTGLAVGAPTVDKALTTGLNAWTFTNVVECHSYLTLDKEVPFGPAVADRWTLEAIGPAGALPGPLGREGEPGATRIEVTPNVDYQLAETADTSPEWLSHYVQDDTRDLPLAFPESTGSWSCTDPTSRMFQGNDGAVAVPLGQEMVCTARNTVSMFSVFKTVEGGTAKSTDFSYQVIPLDPVLPGGHTHTVSIYGPPLVSTLTLRPEQHYQIVEIGPPGYEIVEDQTSCTTAGTPLSRDDFVLPPGGQVTCTFYNRVQNLPGVLSTISLVKVDQPGGNPLAGAVFQLYRSASTAQPGDAPAPADVAVGPACLTPADGICTVTDLPFGDYFWYEVSPPPGFSLPTDRTSPLVTLNAANGGTTMPPYQFTNPRLPGAAQVLKVDEVDRSVLPGGTFNLYLDDGDGVYGRGDSLVGQCTTNTTGTCRLADLDVGTYFWVEVSPPVGYLLPADPVSGPVRVTAGMTSVPQITFADPRAALATTGGVPWRLVPLAALSLVVGSALLVVGWRRVRRSV